MSRLEELQEKYPKYQVKCLPLVDCPVCKGVGEFQNAVEKVHLCACTCVGGPDHLREVMVQALQDTVYGLVGDLKKELRDKRDG